MQLLSFLILTLDGREWFASRSDRFTPATHGMIRWPVIEPEDGSTRQWKVARFQSELQSRCLPNKVACFYVFKIIGRRRPKSIVYIGGSIAVLSVETVSNCLVAVIVIIIIIIN